MYRIRTSRLLNERADLKEKAIVSSKTDEDLEDIAIAVYGGEHPPKHVTILKKDNHKIRLGRFEITDNPPRTFQDIREIKEPIESSLKKQITAWASKRNKIDPSHTNWQVLNLQWKFLNPSL
jgi:predicted methyltransferase